MYLQVLRCEKSTDGGHINYVYEAALSNQKWLVPPSPPLAPDCLVPLTTDCGGSGEAAVLRLREAARVAVPQVPEDQEPNATAPQDCLVHFRLPGTL
jgi:hypothetical protein